MSVDPVWLAQVRQKNQQKFGMAAAPEGGLGFVSATQLNEAMRREQEYRTGAIHAGRFEREDPNKPSEGSVESVAAALAPPPGVEQFAPPVAGGVPLSRTTFWLGVAAAASLVLAVFVAKRRKS